VRLSSLTPPDAIFLGTLDIQGYDPQCPAWEKLQGVGDEVDIPFQHPCDASGNCVEYTITGTCRESAGHTNAWGKYSVYCPIAPTVIWPSGNHGQVFKMVTSNGHIISNGIMHYASNGNVMYFWPTVNDTTVSSILTAGSTMQLHYAEPGYDTIQVSQDAASCWGPGTELVLSSSTRSSADKQLAKVESVDVTTGTIKLDTLITNPITVADHPDYAIEVASLNRRVVFEAESDVDDTAIGGHLIVHHTDTVSSSVTSCFLSTVCESQYVLTHPRYYFQQAQHIEGVEIKNFGQQSRLGRYPIHFHMSGDSVNSLVKKNVV
jgi:hypothetical protein